MKKIILLSLICAQFSACMLKSQHDASIADYQKRAQDSSQLLQENTVLKQQVADLSLRNQDLSTFNQQLVLKNKQLTDNQLNQKNQSLDELKKRQQSRQVYLNIYDQLVTEFPKNSLILKDAYVGLKIKRKQLFSGAQPVLSTKGKALLAQVAQSFLNDQALNVEVVGHTQAQKIKRSLQKNYVSTVSLKAFEAGLVSNYFSENSSVKSVSASVTVGTSINSDKPEIFVLQISHAL